MSNSAWSPGSATFDRLAQSEVARLVKVSQAAAVIKVLEGATAEEAERAVGDFGAPLVASLLAPKTVVAIVGGRTVRELVQLVPECAEPRARE